MSTGKFSASPTKEFFISMLTRDISLEKAIMDLVDNSVDAAKTDLKSNDDKTSLEDYEISIKLAKDKFEIIDNCGGFSKKIAEEYAFKLGRPSDTDSTIENKTSTVGRFGVGMKRGLFKLGKSFEVETKSNNDHFLVKEDVDEWQSDNKGWEFSFIDLPSDKLTSPVLSKSGTRITVDHLHNSVVQDFQLSKFEANFKKELESTFAYSLLEGLVIKLNNKKIEARPVKFLTSDSLKPSFEKFEIEGVIVSIYTGIGEPDPNLAGWYIYCNDRLMVEKDKSNLTGWEGGKKFYDDSGVQKFHNKVAMFRGVVFFNSTDSSKLPMTTTKSGVDVNSALYKTIRSKMVYSMRTVLSRLNKISSADDRSNLVDNSKLVEIIGHNKKENDLSDSFIFPDISKGKTKNSNSLVRYNVDTELLNIVKKCLSVKTNREVGERTFNYFVEMKEIENE